MNQHKNKILIVLHQDTSTPGRVGLMLEKRGFELDIRRPRYGDPLPEAMDDHAGAVIFGGPMSANDSDDFIKKEIDWISVPLRDNAPYLGICLGAQMMAKQLGGEVAAHPDETVEIGYYPISPTEAGAALGGWPGHVYQWHSEGFGLPSGAVQLARGAVFDNQAMRYGDKAYGIQFHPEVTLEMMERWTTKAFEKLELPGAQAREMHFDGWHQYDQSVDHWLGLFLDHWLGDAASIAAAS